MARVINKNRGRHTCIIFMLLTKYKNEHFIDYCISAFYIVKVRFIIRVKNKRAGAHGVNLAHL